MIRHAGSVDPEPAANPETLDHEVALVMRGDRRIPAVGRLTGGTVLQQRRMSRVVLDRDRRRGGAAACECESAALTGITAWVGRRIRAVLDVARVAGTRVRKATLGVTICARATGAGCALIRRAVAVYRAAAIDVKIEGVRLSAFAKTTNAHATITANAHRDTIGFPPTHFSERVSGDPGGS